MPRRPRPLLPFALACAACSTAGGAPRDLADVLAAAPADAPVRLRLDGDRVTGVAVAGGPGLLTAAAKLSLEAVAPRGELRFAGREWGPRGEGVRVEKRYRGEDTVEHDRSVLLADDGTVLERDHTVPIPDVPQHVLAAALRVGTTIDEARIVSGREREEFWRLSVRDRGGREFVVTVALDGRPLGCERRLAARVDG